MFELKKDFMQGALRAVAYYTTGAALVWGTYLVFGWEHIHAPGLHHLVGLLVLVIGAVLLIRRLIEILTHPQNSRDKGSLAIHAIAILCFIFFFKMVNINGAIKRDTGIPLNPEILSADKKSRAVRIEQAPGGVKFLQVADSVRMDR